MIHINPVNPVAFNPNPLNLQRELSNSIENKRVADVQRILALRDRNGATLVDLDGEYGNASSALMWALWWEPVNMEIIDSLLDCRDNQGNLLVDLNREGPHGQTIYSFILHVEDPIVRRDLLQKVLALRGPHGELLADLRSDVGNVALIEKAMLVYDLDCLRMLLNVQREDGRFVLDPNERKFRGTPLEHIERRSEIDAKLRDLLPEMRRMIQEAAARYQPRPAPQVVRPQPLRPAPQVVRPQPPRPAPQVAPQTGEDTHDPSIGRTVAISLRSLEQIYPDASSNEDRVLSEVETLLSHFNYGQLVVRGGLSFNDKKRRAERSWEQVINSRSQTHTYTGFSIGKILSLIWSAIKDDRMEVCTEELKRGFGSLGSQGESVPQAFLELKKASFVEKLVEADLVYDYRSICLGGLIHKLLETLNKAHAAVEICIGDQAVMSAANEVPAFVAKRELLKRSISEQRSIFGSWNREGETAASAFRNQLVVNVRAELTRRFETLITERKKEEICSSIEFLRRPLLHDGLVELLEKIDQLPLSERHRALKERAENPSAEGERWFEEEYAALQNLYNHSTAN